MQAFRSGKIQVLVATDVAARGLDVNDVQLVIQVCLLTGVCRSFICGCMK